MKISVPENLFRNKHKNFGSAEHAHLDKDVAQAGPFFPYHPGKKLALQDLFRLHKSKKICMIFFGLPKNKLTEIKQNISS